MKPLVTDCDALDIRQLAHETGLSHGTRRQWSWYHPNGSLKGTIAIAVLRERLLLAYTQAGTAIHELVPITYSTGCGGGRRPWFQCPACQRRVALLYKHGVRFRCRRCWALGYPSQYPQIAARSCGKPL
jgi:hypothetical protein